jgi:hypothetical protein
VSIRGIDIHASSTADDHSPDWQELAPQLTKQPLQVDLMRGAADRDTREPLGEIVAIPAGVYRHVRVRFVGTSPATDEVTGKIACGGAGFNCAVMQDGTIQPLLFDTASPELRITPERIVDGLLLVLPDVDSELVIEMTPAWSWSASVDSGVHLLPALTGNAKVERVEFSELGTPAGDIARGSLSRGSSPLQTKDLRFFSMHYSRLE